MFIKMQSGFLARLFITLVIGSLLLTACSFAAPTNASPTPLPTLVPVATLAPTATANPIPDDSSPLSLETDGLAHGFQTETIAPVSASESVPYWEVLPQYTRITLDGYPISDHLMKPQIFIYPVDELKQANEGAEMIVVALQALLQSHQETPNMPFLPLFNAAQMTHAQIQYLNFKNGQGVRYLTQFSQSMMPINNHDLIYTYQGLTSDGKYYVAAVLPINHPSLPAGENVTGNEPPEFTGDFPTYLTNVVQGLNSQAANTFTPDLTQLDAMMGSLEVK